MEIAHWRNYKNILATSLILSCRGKISYVLPQIYNYTYGSNEGNSTSDIENSKLVVFFGNNPAETRMSGGGITYYLEEARQRSNARMIVIEVFARGREPRWRPTPTANDTS